MSKNKTGFSSIDYKCCLWICEEQRHYYDVSSFIACHGCLWRCNGNTNSTSRSRSSIGTPCMEHHRNHSIWNVCIEFIECRAALFSFLPVRIDLRTNDVFALHIRVYLCSIQSSSNIYIFFNFFFRYTTFIALYPIGVTGELLCFYWAQSYVKETQLWTVELPNAWNFTFSYFYFLWFIMALYIPLFPQMYMHMWAQRRKVLGGGGKTKGA